MKRIISEGGLLQGPLKGQQWAKLTQHLEDEETLRSWGGLGGDTLKTLRQLPDDLFLQPCLWLRFQDLQTVTLCPNPGP